MIGRKIDERYELQHLLGGGGMSNVYVAWDEILQRKVALKIIHIPPNEKHETVKRFEREVQNTTKLSHENVVSVLDVGEEEDCFFLVMEYIEGPTLYDYIQSNGSLMPDKAVQFFQQILSGIQHAHEHGIVHRDIKPQNMMINRNQTLKIVDFGIAKAISETAMTETNHVVGTVQYLSPEQAKGEATGERSDIYSAGVVLYEMLMGTPPFNGETPVSIAIKHIQDAIPNVTDTRKDVPQALSNVILKATEKDPSNRYSSVSEMAHDVETTLTPDRRGEKPYQTDENATKTVEIDKSALATQPKASQDQPKGTAKIPIVPTTEGNNKNQTMYQPKQKRSLGKKIWFAVIFLVLFVGLFFFMTAAMTKNKYSQVPNVVGQTEENAQKMLKDQNLKVGQMTQRYNDQFDKGRIIQVNPKTETKVKQKSEVDLVISRGPHIEDMPDVRGLPKSEAEKKLKSLGFNQIHYQTAYTQNNIAKGNIESQNISPGESVNVSSTPVTLTESLGVRQIQIGDYTNENFEAVKSSLENEGISVVVDKVREDDDVESGYIINHSPKNEEVDEGADVHFIVSSGKASSKEKDKETSKEDKETNNDTSTQDKEDASNEDEETEDDNMKEDKHITQNVSIPYSGKEDKPQKVDIYVTDKAHKSSSLLESFTITKDTNRSINLTVAEDASASYIIKVDGQTVAQDSFEYDEVA